MSKERLDIIQKAIDKIEKQKRMREYQATTKTFFFTHSKWRAYPPQKKNK